MRNKANNHPQQSTLQMLQLVFWQK